MTRIFGLDGEMSGANIDDGHQLIQIGVACDTTPDGTRLDTPDLFCSLIGWDEQQLVWSDRAAKVHNIPREAVLAAPRAPEVDAALYNWLTAHGANPDSRMDITLTGYNVGAFDMPFVRAALPRSATMWSRRWADLNGPCLLFASAAPQLLGSQGSFATWKKKFTRAGLDLVASIGREEKEHDAGTDALIALGAWRAMEDTLSQLDRDAANQRRAARAARKASTNLNPQDEEALGWGSYI